MFTKIGSFGAMLALLMVAAGPATVQAKSDKKTRAVCCANHPASHAKCCASGKKEACCHGEKASKSDAVRVCAITGKPLEQCCGKKAAQNPPCCQKGCKHAGKVAQ